MVELHFDSMINQQQIQFPIHCLKREGNTLYQVMAGLCYHPCYSQISITRMIKNKQKASYNVESHLMIRHPICKKV